MSTTAVQLEPLSQPPDFEKLNANCHDVITNWIRSQGVDLIKPIFEIISKFYLNKLYGESRGDYKIFSLKKNDELVIGSAAAMDSIGTNYSNKVGGYGGRTTKLPLNEPIISIEGEICRTTSIHQNPHKIYLHTLIVRTKRKFYCYGGLNEHRWSPQYTFSIHQRENQFGLDQIIVYSDGYCINGIWAQ